jgi:hypothetical protein
LLLPLKGLELVQGVRGTGGNIELGSKEEARVRTRGYTRELGKKERERGVQVLNTPFPFD